MQAFPALQVPAQQGCEKAPHPVHWLLLHWPEGQLCRIPVPPALHTIRSAPSQLLPTRFWQPPFPSQSPVRQVVGLLLSHSPFLSWPAPWFTHLPATHSWQRPHSLLLQHWTVTGGQEEVSHWAFTHLLVPLVQRFEQVSTRSSSTIPSQSLSLPSHTSGVALLGGTQLLLQRR
jgi:hypothetical protein